ncbi:MAG: ribbon-helix-helix protein, CopG family [Planctomycetes bacterium]|nr:ribbon-helix-helix protein, CopG family [Planctomycetota bacterium]
MSTKTVNIAFQDDLLREIDLFAKRESRSRSEFLREAARMYIDRKERWNDIFALGKDVAKSRKLTEGDVLKEIHAHRKGGSPRR